MLVDDEMKKVARRNMEKTIIDSNVYWQTAVAVIDTWKECLCRIRRFENAHRIKPLIEEEYNGCVYKLRDEKDEYCKLVNLHLSIFDLICVNFNIEPITLEWLKDNVNTLKACKMLAVHLKNLMQQRCEPISIRCI